MRGGILAALVTPANQRHTSNDDRYHPQMNLSGYYFHLDFASIILSLEICCSPHLIALERYLQSTRSQLVAWRIALDLPSLLPIIPPLSRPVVLY